MLWWWFARNRQQARGTLPPCLHCQTATGNNPHAWVLPLGTGGNGGSKKIPGGGFLALGMLRSAAKVGLTGHIFRKQTEMKSKGYPSPNVNAQRPTQPSVQSLPFTLYNFIPHPSASTWKWFGLKPVCVVRFLHLGQNGLVVTGLRYLVGWFSLD